jgi:hypothetical protein
LALADGVQARPSDGPARDLNAMPSPASSGRATIAARVHTELGENAADVSTDRPQAQVQQRGNALVRVAANLTI